MLILELRKKECDEHKSSKHYIEYFSSLNFY